MVTMTPPPGVAVVGVAACMAGTLVQPVAGTCGGCELSDATREALVSVSTVGGLLSVVAVSWVLIALHISPKRMIQPRRIIRSIFTPNLFFALLWVLPVRHGLMWPGLERTASADCVLQSLYESLRLLCAAVELRVLLYSYYCIRLQREGIPRWVERLSLAFCYVLSLLVCVTFLAVCLGPRHENDGASRDQANDFSIVFFVLGVLPVALSRALMQHEGRHQRRVIRGIQGPEKRPPAAQQSHPQGQSHHQHAQPKSASVSLVERLLAPDSNSDEDDAQRNTSGGDGSVHSDRGGGLVDVADDGRIPGDRQHAGQPRLRHDGSDDNDSDDNDDDMELPEVDLTVSPTRNKHRFRFRHVWDFFAHRAQWNEASSRRVLAKIVKPLELYPVTFLLFVCPQIVIVISDHSSSSDATKQLVRGVCQTIIPFRGVALALVFGYKNKPDMLLLCRRKLFQTWQKAIVLQKTTRAWKRSIDPADPTIADAKSSATAQDRLLEAGYDENSVDPDQPYLAARTSIKWRDLEAQEVLGNLS